MEDWLFLAQSIMCDGLTVLMDDIGKKIGKMSDTVFMFSAEPRMGLDWPDIGADTYFGVNGEPFPELLNLRAPQIRRVFGQVVLPTYRPNWQEMIYCKWSTPWNEGWPYEENLPSRFVIEWATRPNRITKQKITYDSRSSDEFMMRLALDHCKWMVQELDYRILQGTGTLKYMEVFGTKGEARTLFDPSKIQQFKSLKTKAVRKPKNKATMWSVNFVDEEAEQVGKASTKKPATQKRTLATDAINERKKRLMKEMGGACSLTLDDEGDTLTQNDASLATDIQFLEDVLLKDADLAEAIEAENGVESPQHPEPEDPEEYQPDDSDDDNVDQYVSSSVKHFLGMPDEYPDGTTQPTPAYDGVGATDAAASNGPPAKPTAPTPPRQKKVAKAKPTPKLTPKETPLMQMFTGSTYSHSALV
jgi:hypothetical protein